MRYILIFLLFTACKTTTVQNVSYTIQVPEQVGYTKTPATLSSIDSLPELRQFEYSLPDILQSLPAPIQQVSGKGPVVIGDSNQVAGRKVKQVDKEKTRNVENDTGWLIWIGGFVVTAILIYFLIRR